MSDAIKSQFQAVRGELYHLLQKFALVRESAIVLQRRTNCNVTLPVLLRSRSLHLSLGEFLVNVIMYSANMRLQ